MNTAPPARARTRVFGHVTPSMGSSLPRVDLADTENQRHDAPHYAYLDAIQIWVQHPLSPKNLKWLSGQCGAKRLGPPFLRNERPWWNRDYRQGLRLTQPSRAALEWLAKRDDTLMTYAELAFDYIGDEDSTLQLPRIFSEHFVQRWHGKRRTQIFVNSNGRTAKRGRLGSSVQWYADKLSKLTGACDCFHLEIQIQGSAALRRSDIDCVGDLLDFDYPGILHRHLDNAFWTVNRERLGRFHENKRKGTRRRRTDIRLCRGRFPFNVDGAIGSVLYKVHAAHPDDRAESVQQFVDTYGRGPFLTPVCNVKTPVTQTQRDQVEDGNRGEHGLCGEDGNLRRYFESIDDVTLEFPLGPREES